MTTSASGDPLIGRKIIGQYVIRSKLGEGGMGAVYLADQPSVGRQAVVKVMHPGISRDATVAPRFEVEARAASQLNHPNIVTIYNYGTMEDGTLFLAMEHCDGSSLEQLLRQGPIASERVLGMAIQICDALAEAHRCGVVHRDLKPSNIMVVERGRRSDFVKVLDFGIAKLEGIKMTRTGSVVGTPQYMSPEQLRGDPLDGRSDLYSLGVVLYEMVSGRLPFKADSAAGYMHKHLHEPPRSPVEVGPDLGISPVLEAVILGALVKDRRDRFADAELMARALEAPPDLIPEELRQARKKALQRRGRPESRGAGMWIAVAASVLVAVAATVVLVLLLLKPSEQQPVVQATVPGGATTWRSLDSGSKQAEVAPLAVEADSGVTRDAPAGKHRRSAKKARSARSKRVRLAMTKTTTDKAPTDKAASNKAASDRAPTDRAPTDRATVTSTADPPAASPYDGLSIKKLEAELRRVIGNAKVPPSTVDQIMEGYQNALALWPPEHKERMRRNYLAQLIKTYKGPSLQYKPHERKSLAQLKKIFLSMETKANLSLAQREKILDNALSAYDKDTFKAKDRPFYKRLALLGMIKNMAADPAKVLK